MQLEAGGRSNGVWAYAALVVAVVSLIVAIIAAVRASGAARSAAGAESRAAEMERKISETASSHEKLVQQMSAFATQARQSLQEFGQRIMRVEADLSAVQTSSAVAKEAGSAKSSEAARTNITTAQPSGRVYEVKSGDTMEKIARAHNVNLADLLQLTPDVDPRRMKVGTKLRLP